MLVILGGLPGVGKTTLARELARRIGAIHLRIDTIEQPIVALYGSDASGLGYRIGYGVAEDNLRLGRIVIADAVNCLKATRDAWRDIAGAWKRESKTGPGRIR